MTRLKSVAIMVVLSCVVASLATLAALVPPQFSDAVVALGSMQPIPLPGQIALPGQPCVWATEGTGFLYGSLSENDPDPSKRKYTVFLVTNRHVIEEHAATLAIAKINRTAPLPPGPNCDTEPKTEDSISIRLNPLQYSLQGQKFDLPLKDWFFHTNPNIDIAVYPLNGEFLKEKGLLGLFFTSDQITYNKELLKSNGVAAGDGVFVLGFPMNLAGIQRNYVIVRQGCIARLSEMLDGKSPSFLIDAFIFPGNSGSPVVLKPEITSIYGTKVQSKASLIGIVKSYQPYTDIAFSPQSKRPRISFEENSGLAEVLPVDDIDETIAAWRKLHP